MYFSRVRIDDQSQLTHQKLYSLAQGDHYTSHQLLWQLFPDRPDEKGIFLYRQEIEKEQLPLQTNGRRGFPIFYVLSKYEPVSLPGLLKIDSKAYKPALFSGQRLAFELRANPVVARKREGQKWSGHCDVLVDAQHALLNDLLSKLGVPSGSAMKKQQKKLAILKTIEGIKDGLIHSVNEHLKAIVFENPRHKANLAASLTLPDLVESALKATADTAAASWLTERSEKLGFQIENESLQIDSYQQFRLKANKQSKKIEFSTVDYQGRLLVNDPEKFIHTLYKGIGRAKAFGCGLLLVRRI